MPLQCHLQRQKGSALILVLWVSLLLSLLLIGIITVSRSELRLSKAREQTFLANNAAKAALETTAFEIATNRDISQKFTSKTLIINGFTVLVEKSEEAKKLDLNFASEAELSKFFIFLGQDLETAQSIAANIADWRDTDDLARANGAEARDYVRARDQRRPANRPFHSVSELNLVLEVSENLARCASAGLTTFGETQGLDPVFLSALYANPYPRKQTQSSTTSLGTAARVSNAGARYSLVAIVTDKQIKDRILARTLGAFRVSGTPQKPYAWIAQIQLNSFTEKPECESLR